MEPVGNSWSWASGREGGPAPPLAAPPQRRPRPAGLICAHHVMLRTKLVVAFLGLLGPAIVMGALLYWGPRQMEQRLERSLLAHSEVQAYLELALGAYRHLQQLSYAGHARAAGRSRGAAGEPPPADRKARGSAPPDARRAGLRRPERARGAPRARAHRAVREAAGAGGRDHVAGRRRRPTRRRCARTWTGSIGSSARWSTT